VAELPSMRLRYHSAGLEHLHTVIADSGSEAFMSGTQKPAEQVQEIFFGSLGPKFARLPVLMVHT
jgi:hypothetical protein